MWQRIAVLRAAAKVNKICKQPKPMGVLRTRICFLNLKKNLAQAAQIFKSLLQRNQHISKKYQRC